jgi:hypothetical protein
MEKQDGAVSALLLSQQEAVVCEWWKSRTLQFEQWKGIKFCQKKLGR